MAPGGASRYSAAGSEQTRPAMFFSDPAERRAEWHRYYDWKRVPHQAYQLSLMAELPVRTVLEIGPYLGLVTAMGTNAGYAFTTLDLGPQNFAWPQVPHIQTDLRTVAVEQLRGFDLILCCETLEHLPMADSREVLRRFHASGAPHLITSVPFMGLQIQLQLNWNPHHFRRYFSFKKGRSLRRFQPDPDPMGHKWELGYKGYALKDWEAVLEGTGYRIRRRGFINPARSVFHVLDRV